MSLIKRGLFVGSDEVHPLLRDVGLQDVIPHLDEVQLFLRFEMSRLGLAQPHGLCVTATRMLKNSLMGGEHVPAIVEGEVRLGPGDYIEHRISLFRQEDFWLALDLTASQFGRFAGTDLVAIVSGPSNGEILQQLRAEFDWV